MTHTAYLIDMGAIRLSLEAPAPIRFRPTGMSPRELAEDAYAEALDDLEERWLGTRTHVSRLEWQRTIRRWGVRRDVMLGMQVMRPEALARITGVS